MRDRKHKTIRWIYSIATAFLFSFGAFACGGGSSQIGGIVGEVRFNTQACVPQQKIVNIRNDDTANPQRVMGVYFELGTNEKNNYKINKVVVGSTEYTPTASLAQEVLIPAGGIMSIHTTYFPKVATRGSPDLSYLDMFLNGPKLGILQIKMNGAADPSDLNCTGGDKFKVTALHVIIKAPPTIPTDFLYDVPPAEITKTLTISGSGDTATVTPDNFPDFAIKGEALSAVPGNTLPISLSEDTTVSYDRTSFNANAVTLTTLGGITVTGKWTTGESSATGSKGTISLTGQALADGKMKLVYTAAMENNATLTSVNLDGGVVGFEMELEKQE